MSTVEATDKKPSPNIVITESAQDYLEALLAKQDAPDIGVRIFVEKPGTPAAECCMAYCHPGDEHAKDYLIALPNKFKVFLEHESLDYLEDACIDYNKDRFGGQLTFKAPKAKVPKIDPDAGIKERINYILYLSLIHI